MPDNLLYLTSTSASGPLFFSLLCGLVYILYPFFNFAMILLEPYLNVSSNFLINCLLCFTKRRLSCYAVSKNWAFFHLEMIYVAKHRSTCCYCCHVGGEGDDVLSHILTARLRDREWQKHQLFK